MRIRTTTSLADLLDGATERAPMKTGDSLSGARFERVRIGGEPFVVKHLSVEDDWLMRATGDFTCVQRLFWSSELPARIPEAIDHTVVGIAEEPAPVGRIRVALLMRDVGEHLVPEGSSRLADEQHLRFFDHMAELHAAFWGWRDHLGLLPRAVHYTIFNRYMPGMEVARGTTGVPTYVDPGFARLPQAAPRAAGLIAALRDDPGPLLTALDQTPSTFVHGDWKLGNLGSHPDGRTVLFDWDRCGEGAATFELAWYLAVNCDRMALSKEDAIAAYRAALERRGVDTAAWWDRQLALSLLGGFLMLAWSKTGGDPREIGWWEDRAVEAERLL